MIFSKAHSMQHKITKVSSFAEVWECNQSGQKSLHARVRFQEGDYISSLGAKETLTAPNYLTVQLNEQEHILLDPDFLQYINHSCQPNVIFDATKKVVTCLRKIDAGEEMVFFYPSTEWSMDQKFECHCGTEKCLGLIKGAAYISPDILKKYHLSDYVQCQVISNALAQK